MSITVWLQQLEQHAWFRQAHRFLVSKNTFLQKFFLPVWALLLIMTSLGAWIYSANLLLYLTIFYELGKKLGSVAVVLYVLTLIPGMLKRFGVLPLTRSLLMLTRRQIGVTMFLSALGHQALVQLFPLLLSGQNPFFTTFRTTLGSLALMVLFPLWLTSNDFSVQKLQKNWKRLHRLTYVALALIFGHVFFTGELFLKILLGLAMFLEVWSGFHSLRIASAAGRTPQSSSGS